MKRILCLILIQLFFCLPTFAQKASLCSQIFSETSVLPAFLQHAIAVNKYIARYMETETRVSHRRFETTAAAKTTRILQAIYNKPIQWALPISTRNIISWEAPANKVFLKLWKNRNYEPTAEEWATLKKYQATDAFQERQSFLKDHSKWHRFRKSLSLVQSGSLMAFFLLQSYFSAASVPNSVDADAYLDDPKADENTVELLNESVPFPHVAIRIGRHVYSYGYQNMTVSTLSEYILERQLTPAEGKMEKLVRKLPRVIQAIQLKLTLQERENLQKALELNTGKAYRNILFVNDCASMIARALRENTSIQIPSSMDMSPMAMFSFLVLKKMKGDQDIGWLRQIATDQEKIDVSTGLRNLWINSMEAKIWYRTIPFNLPLRAVMDLTMDEKEIQDFDSEQKRQIESYMNEVRAGIEQSLEVQSLRQRIQLKTSSVQEVEAVIALLSEPHQETLANSEESLVTLLTAQYSLESLQQIKNEFIEKIKKGENL